MVPLEAKPVSIRMAIIGQKPALVAVRRQLKATSSAIAKIRVLREVKEARAPKVAAPIQPGR